MNKLNFRLLPSREERLNESFITRVFNQTRVKPEGFENETDQTIHPTYERQGIQSA
jgi:hypothetical protein